MQINPRKYKIGEVLPTNGYGNVVITGYCKIRDSRSARFVKFLDTGFDAVYPCYVLKSGEMRDPYKPAFYNLGFMGFGVYSSKDKDAFRCWTGMMKRCYCKKYKSKYKTYEGCYVSSEWLDFQNFAKWFYENKPNDNKKYHLDKDIKIKGNKLYSKDTCSFVEEGKNVAFSAMKSFLFYNPRGRRVLVKNLADFCRKMNLNKTCMWDVSKGERQFSHKGWTKA